MIKKFLVFLTAAAASVTLSVCSFADIITDELAPLLKKAAYDRTELIDVSEISKKAGWDRNATVYNAGLAYLYSPDLFFVSNKYSVYYSGNGEYFVSFEYLMSEEDAAAAKIKLDSAAKLAVAGITDDMSDVEKALYVHDYIILNCKYDFSYNRYDAYNCLINNSAVCQGYSLAYMYILKEYLGIDCTIAYSDSTAHAWNYVCIDGSWYHVDLTSDDPSSNYRDVSRDNCGFVLHTNFMISDEECRKTSELHRNWQIIGSKPSADSKKYDNAFWRSVTSAVCFKGRVCYYVLQEDTKDSKGRIISDIYSYDFADGKTVKLLDNKSRWYSVRSSDGSRTSEYGKAAYTDTWTKLAIIGDYLYFNTNKNIYRYGLNNRKCKKIFTLEKGDNQIFGIVKNGERLRAAYRYDLTYAESYINLIFQ